MPPPTLLTLPVELRQEIYAHLIPPSPQPVYNPITCTSLTSVSHAPPHSNLLNIHAQLTDEIMDYYFTQAS